MKTKTIVFDIDGVLADFIKGAVDVARGLFEGKSFPDVTTLSHQQWDVYPGMDASEVTKVWQFIAQHPQFWQHLSPLASKEEFSAIKDLIAGGHRVYFATNRKTPGALGCTHMWLYQHLVWNSETSDFVPINVITTHRKGEFCKVVEADYYIDDKSENADCATWMTDGRTKSFVITRPYNSGAKAAHSHKVKTVVSVAEFLAEVTK